MIWELSRRGRLRGDVRVPSDKSLTHRAYLFGSFASGPCRVETPLLGQDCESTLGCLQALGTRVERDADGAATVYPGEWSEPGGPLDCGNSGTTMRLLAGLLAGRGVRATMVGDASLSRRPMKRIAEPLRLMGAMVEGDTPPLTIVGGNLRGIDYASPVASGQIKSCVLLAGLFADGETSVTEPSVSRDHTERMLRAMEADLEAVGTTVTLRPGRTLRPFAIRVPADISSAAFPMVAAALAPGSEVRFLDLSVNPSRTGILDVFEQAGIGVTVESPREELGEPVADVTVSAADLRAFRIDGAMVPRLIDEIPVLAVLATQCQGVTTIRDAAELRVKESDRIEVVASALRAMGAKVETRPDGMDIEGPTPLTGAEIEANHDHRIAMAFAVAAGVADGVTRIRGAEAVETSFPGFLPTLERLAHA